MLWKFLRPVLVAALVLVGVVTAFLAHMIYGERKGKELASTFCSSVKVDDDPIDVLARATRSEALRSSLVWLPPDGTPKTLELVFKGGFPLSAHGCRIQASEKITSAVYFHSR